MTDFARPGRGERAFLSAQALRDRVSYDPLTGCMTWKAGCRPALIGKEVGSIWRGYRVTKFDGRNYQLHRLAWLYVHGELPDGEIDHVNGVGTDNRIANLRIATRQQNAVNRRAQGGRALKGITANRNKWAAQIRINGKNTYLGSFDTPEQAHAVYAARARELHGEFARLA